MSEELEVVRGSGNVFADFGDADADTKLLKAQMATEIITALDKQGLTVRAGATKAGVDPADIQRIRNGDLSRFTLDRLIRVAYRLGRKVEMKVSAVTGRPRVAAG
jgi:predicted XRE-type DNA-binding protein